MPKWSSDNFWNHYGVRLEEKSCRKIYPPTRSGLPISEDEYRDLSDRSVNKSWAEAIFYDNEKREWRRFFADEDLVMSITDDDGRYYITCHHKHLSFQRSCKRMMEMTEDDRKEEFDRWVEDMTDKDKRWQKLEWKRKER